MDIVHLNSGHVSYSVSLHYQNIAQMQVCTETNPRILFEDFKFFAFTFLAIILVGARPSHLGALGAMVSLEKSAKKVTVTQTTNKTT